MINSDDLIGKQWFYCCSLEYNRSLDTIECPLQFLIGTKRWRRRNQRRWEKRLGINNWASIKYFTVNSKYLEESKFVSLITEAPSAHHQMILSDEAMSITTTTANKKENQLIASI